MLCEVVKVTFMEACYCSVTVMMNLKQIRGLSGSVIVRLSVRQEEVLQEKVKKF